MDACPPGPTGPSCASRKPWTLPGGRSLPVPQDRKGTEAPPAGTGEGLAFLDGGPRAFPEHERRGHRKRHAGLARLQDAVEREPQREKVNRQEQRERGETVYRPGVKARKERRIEFAFEEQRFYDVRRWKVGPETQTTLHGVRFVSPTEFKITKTDIRTWNDRLYLTPIPHDEIVRSSVLTQNPGY